MKDSSLENSQRNQNTNTNVYVLNLPASMTLKKFRLLFSPFGTIIGIRLVPRRKGHSPVGFVQYTHPEMAAQAICRMDGRWVEGHTLSVTLAKRDKDKGIDNKPCTNLYVANLPSRYDEADLEKMFSKFGDIHSLRILRYQDTGLSKGTALVRFESLQDAMAAKEALHCSFLHKQALPLEVKYAESKEDRLIRRDETKTARKKSSDSEIPDDLDDMLTYVAEVMDRYNSDWDHKVVHTEDEEENESMYFRRATRPKTKQMQGTEAGNRDALKALTDYMKVMLGPDNIPEPAESPLSRGSSHEGSSFGYATESVDGDKADQQGSSTSASRLNPMAAPFVPKMEGQDRKAVESIVVESLAARISKMDSTELAKLSALLALGQA